MIDLRDSRLVFALLLLLVGISVLIFTANYDGISVGSYFSNAISNTHKNAIANADVDQRPAQISPDSPLGRKCLRPGVINCFGFDDAAALYYNWPTGTACDEALRGKTNYKFGNGRQGQGNTVAVVQNGECIFPEIDTADNYAPLKSVHSIVLIAKQSWYQGNPDVAANFARAWDAVTKWIYDPANKDELLAISKKAMGGTDAGVQAVYKLHIESQSVPQNLRMNEKMLQQFTDNLRKAGADNVPTDAMKYVDISVVAKTLNV